MSSGRRSNESWCDDVLVCSGPCNIGTRALTDTVPLEKGMVLSDGQFSFATFFIVFPCYSVIFVFSFQV